MPLLELTDIARHYGAGSGRVVALDGVSLTIEAGEFVAIMGPSGSGKSTLMHIIGCLDRPDGGSYRVHGRDVASLDADGLAALRRQTFGFVFQRYNLLPGASAQANVEMPAIYAGLPRARRSARARQLLEELGLGERAGHRPNALSGGQHDDRAPGLVQALEQGHQLGTAAAVEGAGRFVGQDHRRVVDQRPGHGHALLLAAGQRVRPVTGALAQAQFLQ